MAFTDDNLTLDALAAEAAANEAANSAAEEGGRVHGDASSVHGGIPTREILYPAIRLVMDVVAPSWRITDAECETLSDSYAAVIDKYFPDGLGAYGVEVSAIIVTAIVFAPRMKTPRRPINVTPEEVKPDDGRTAH